MVIVWEMMFIIQKHRYNPEASNDEFDLTMYVYLVDTTHYDLDDECVFMFVRIVAEDFRMGALVVVYRSAYIINAKEWHKEDKSSVHVRDIIKYHNDERTLQK